MIPFQKMHGLGNDFVVIDARHTPVALTEGSVRAIADRRSGVGFNQMILIEAPTAAGADAVMRILNADGGEVEACGNAARCIGDLLIREKGGDTVTLDTQGGRIQARAASEGLITVDMGPVKTAWDEIPLAHEMDTLSVAVNEGAFKDATCINVGNPHAVFFFDDAEAQDIEAMGPIIEHHALFPARINVEAVSLNADGSLRMRVWERGVGITQACGTGACAALAAAVRLGLTNRATTVHLDGGALHIAWPEAGPDAGHVLMTGPVAYSFSGVLSNSLVSHP